MKIETCLIGSKVTTLKFIYVIVYDLFYSIVKGENLRRLRSFRKNIFAIIIGYFSIFSI